MANWQQQSIPVTSALGLILAAGIAVGIASRSLWWGIAATLLQVAAAWSGFKVVLSMAMTQHAMLKAAVERMEKKLDTLSAAKEERRGNR